MFQIDSSTAATSLPTPSVPGPHPNGFFNANTTITADFLNAIMMEVCHVITATGGTLSKTDRTQLYTAIQSMVTGASGLTSVVDDTSPQLGGNLDVNGHMITSSADMTLQAGMGNNILLDCSTVSVTGDIALSSDTTNKISFGSGTQTYYCSSNNVMDLSASGLRLGAIGARVTQIDNDNVMTANSATRLATQAAIVGYVGAQLSVNTRVSNFYGISASSFSGGSTNYFGNSIVTGSAPGASDATKYLCYVVSDACVVSDLSVGCNTAPGTGQSVTITLFVNGSASSLVATISGTNSVANDTTHTASLSAGDAICVQVVLSATASSTYCSWNLKANF